VPRPVPAPPAPSAAPAAIAASISSWRKGQPVGRQRHPVEALGQVDHRRVAAVAHIRDDRGDGVVDLGRILALHRQKRREAISKSASVVFRNTGMLTSSAPSGPCIILAHPLTGRRRRVKRAIGQARPDQCQSRSLINTVSELRRRRGTGWSGAAQITTEGEGAMFKPTVLQRRRHCA
jgi:hypothetical protein